jgi:hypothetical protein|tara:strand:- start:16068 stop:16247 length:180 start_codon:yes stop_codon:yes gene_type:complete
VNPNNLVSFLDIYQVEAHFKHIVETSKELTSIQKEAIQAYIKGMDRIREGIDPNSVFGE